jgi:hypothetical protein
MLEETLGGYSLQAFNLGNNAGMVVENRDFERNRDLATTMKKGAHQKRMLAEGPKCIIGTRS